MILPRTLDRFVETIAPEHDEIQSEMAIYAREHGFPIIGPAAGAILTQCALMRNATRIFEFGSGFGYSATWFLKGLAPEGEIILTEVDPDELALAEEYLDRAGELDRVILEAGDALEIIESYDGPFDCVLLDLHKSGYPQAFELVHDKLAAGGVVIADNILDGPVRYDELLPYLRDESSLPEDETVAGLVSYLRLVQSTPGCHTTIIPVDEGLAVTHCQ